MCHCGKTKAECPGCPCRIGFAIYAKDGNRFKVPTYCDGTDAYQTA